uniref:Uncharacterized protein LOC111114367 n=1 Tax=Crassostrea virginica TaxID=6565 RepID=A0A8B8BYA1_CRAVI
MSMNLVHNGFRLKAAMTGTPQTSAWNADKAIDGITSQDYQSNSCAISEVDVDKLTKSYWKEWIEPSPFNIGYLEIYFRSDTYKRSTGFSIYTYNTQNFYPFIDPKHLIYRHDPLAGCPSPIMNVTVNKVTQGIVFINERPPGYRSNCQGDNTQYVGIELCEIKVMGCDQVRFSSGCSKLCPSKCKNRHCDAFNGSCIHGCSNPNALTVDCLACYDGQYIRDKMCVPCEGHCKNGIPCNKLTGRCDNGCHNYWIGEFCEVCPPHYYGNDCNTPCGN